MVSSYYTSGTGKEEAGAGSETDVFAASYEMVAVPYKTGRGELPGHPSYPWAVKGELDPGYPISRKEMADDPDAGM